MGDYAGFVVNICVFLTKLLQKTQKTDKYTCAMCKGVFYKSVPEDEALAELKEFFGDIPVEDCEVVCENCWQEIRPDKHGLSLPVLEDNLLAEPTKISEIMQEFNLLPHKLKDLSRFSINDIEEAKCRFIEKWKAQWKGLPKSGEVKILLTDELKADQIYDWPGELFKALNKENKANG